jgi:hypothetical protein
MPYSALYHADPRQVWRDRLLMSVFDAARTRVLETDHVPGRLFSELRLSRERVVHELNVMQLNSHYHCTNQGG